MVVSCADVLPSVQLLFCQDALVDSLNVIFTRSLHDLSKAEWAIVNREEYMRIVRERKAQCPVFSEVEICEQEAGSRLLVHGVPEHVHACALEVDGAEHAFVRLQGPASRAPEVGHQADAAGESEGASDSEHSAAPEDSDAAQLAASSSGASPDVAELSIAVDPVHAVKPVQMMQALQGFVDAYLSLSCLVLGCRRFACGCSALPCRRVACCCVFRLLRASCLVLRSLVRSRGAAAC